MKNHMFFNILSFGASKGPPGNLENLEKVMCLLAFGERGVSKAPADHPQAIMVNVHFLLVFTCQERP